jgi:hypothetical protein
MKSIITFIRSILVVASLGVILVSFSLSNIGVYAAPIITVTTTILDDGIAPFDVDNLPGHDSGPNNGIIRTNEYLTIKTDISVNGGNATNVSINFPFAFHNGAQASNTAGNCLNYGYSSTQMFCNVGNLNSGSTTSITVQFGIPPTFGNGHIINYSPTGYSSETGNVLGNTVIFTTSATPRVDLDVSDCGYSYAPGPANEPGFKVCGYMSTGGLYQKGAESLKYPYSFNANLTYVTAGNTYQGARLYNWNPQYPYCPTDFTCTQPGGPGTQVTVSSPSTGFLPQYLSSTVVYWIPLSDIQATPTGSNLTYKIAGSNFDPDGVTGTSNFGSAIEPLGNNEITKTITIVTGATFTKYSSGVKDSTTYGIPFIIPGNQTLWQNVYYNSSSALPLNNIVICDKIDISKHVLSSAEVKSEYYAATTYPGAIVEYSTSALTPNYASSTCENTDGPWYSNIGSIPGGISAVTRVRGTNIQNLAPGNGVALYVKTIPNNLPNNTIITNTSQARSGEINSGNWSFSTASAQISKVIGYVSKRSDVYYFSQSVLAGGTMGYSIDARFVSTTGSTSTSDLSVIDVLPSGQTFIPGSSSYIPSSVVVNSNGTTTITWLFPNASVNSNYYIRYDTKIAISNPNNTYLNNTAYIYSSDMAYTSPLNQPCQNITYSTCETAGVRVINSNILYIQKIANQRYITPNQNLNYTIEYGNVTNSTFANTDLIDIFPYNGDARTPASSFQGDVHLSSITGLASNETLFYTKTLPVNLNTDPCHISNIPAGNTTSPTCVASTLSGGSVGTGSTVWCSSLSGGVCPANNNEVSAIRVKSINLTGGGSHTFNLNLTTNGNTSDSTYTNLASARASGLNLQVYSNASPTSVSLGEITGNIVDDQNQNGYRDWYETGLENVALTITGSGLDGIYGNSDDFTATTTTNLRGDYIFNGLLVGTYKITVTPRPGTTQTFDNDGLTTPNEIVNRTITFDSTNGSNKINYQDFGYSTPPHITGKVFIDLNGNGYQDTSEPDGNIPSGYTITISNGTNNYIVTVDANGSYDQIVAPGYYSITSNTPSNYNSTTVSTRYQNAMSRNNQVSEFGMREYIPAHITGKVFIDLNGNGYQDTSEPDGNIPSGYTIVIADGLNYYAVSVQSDGSYDQEVVSGYYGIQFNSPSGYYATTSTSLYDYFSNGSTTAVSNFGISQHADLSIVKTSSGGSDSSTNTEGIAYLGAPLDYTLTIANNGPGIANGPITIYENVPTNFVYTGTDAGPWNCYDYGYSFIYCQLNFALVNGESSQLIIHGYISETSSSTVSYSP